MSKKTLHVDRFEEALDKFGFKITWNCANCKCKTMTMTIKTECDKCHNKTIEIFPVTDTVKRSKKDSETSLPQEDLPQAEADKPLIAKDLIEDAIEKGFLKAITGEDKPKLPCLHHCKGVYCMAYHSSGVQCPMCSKCGKYFQGLCSEEKPNV